MSHCRLRAFARTLLVLTITPLLGSAAQAQTTALFFDSQPGDYVGAGRKTSLNSVDVNFTARRDNDNTISINVSGPGFTFWHLNFRGAGSGLQPVVGTYTSARRASFTSGNGLDIGGDGRGCNQVTGRFVVLEAVYSGSQVVRFAADFEQHCDDAIPGLFGVIRYNSTISSLVPFGGQYPPINLTIVPPAHGRVRGQGVDCGGAATACSLAPAAPGPYALSATPDPGYIFAGWSQDCAGAPTTSVMLNSSKVCAATFLPVIPDGPRSLAIITGSPAEYLSRGKTHYLSDANSMWTLHGTFGTELVIRYDNGRGESNWRISFAPPTGQSFVAGQEYVATRFGSATEARLDIYADSSGCGDSFSSLVVREWVAGTGSVPERFVFDFRHTCQGTGPITGLIQYRSTTSLPMLQLDRTSLVFGITRTGTTIRAHSSDQFVQIRQTGAGATSWELKSNQPWLTASPASGSGSGTITIKIKGDGSVPFEPGPLTGHITILTRGAAGVPEPVLATVNLVDWTATTPPFGSFDTPLDGTSGVRGSIGITGWAMDDVGVSGLRLYRSPVAGEPANQLVFVGTPARVDGARPDVANAFPALPMNTQAGWGYLLLTNMLPNGGDGSFTFHVFADDVDGHSTLLGSRTIVCANGTGSFPFGAVDTPAQGEMVSGVVNNFGWVLSPGVRRADPTGGGAVTVFVDGLPIGSPSGWASRADLSALFPVAEYSGVGSALGVFTFDTAALANGTHTIAWAVTDDQGNAAGIGSRYFTVFNGAGLTSARVAFPAAARLLSRPLSRLRGTPIEGRRGFDPTTPFRMYREDVAGTTTVHAEELDRIELRLAARAGRLLTGATPAALPIGSSLDADGTFTWQPGVAFVGLYRLAFDTATGARIVRIVLHPKGSNRVGPQIVIDTPTAASLVEGMLEISGWAADLDAGVGSGINTVHAWAYPARGGAPVFLGAAIPEETRPDVGDVYGAQFTSSGFTIEATPLLPGDYDVAVFAWSAARRDFLPARTVRVSVR